MLLKQDQDEARGNVDKRLEWIEGEMCVAVLCGSLSRICIRTRGVLGDDSFEATAASNHPRRLCTPADQYLAPFLQQAHRGKPQGPRDQAREQEDGGASALCYSCSLAGNQATLASSGSCCCVEVAIADARLSTGCSSSTCRVSTSSSCKRPVPRPSPPELLTAVISLLPSLPHSQPAIPLL